MPNLDHIPHPTTCALLSIRHRIPTLLVPPHHKSGWIYPVLGHSSEGLGPASPRPPHEQAEGPCHFQGEAIIYIPTHRWLFTVPLVEKFRHKLFGSLLCLLSHHTVHQKQQRRKFTPPLKAGLQVLAFLVPLILCQYFILLCPCIGVFIHVHHTNVKVTHHSGIPEAEDTSIHT